MSDAHPKITLSTKQEQKQQLNQQQVQSLKVLQMTYDELMQQVKEQILSNPVLEEGSKVRKDPDFAYIGAGTRRSSGAAEFEKYYKKEKTLSEHLLEQLSFLQIGDDVRRLCEEVIGCIGSDGYLDEGELKLLVEKGPLEQTEKLEQALGYIRDMDPPGVGSRNLRENLLKQLEEKNLHDEVAYLLVRDYLDDISENRVKKIVKDTGLKTPEITTAIDVIKTLEPKPGRAFSTNEPVKYAVPEVIVHEKDGMLIVSTIDERIPSITLNQEYVQMAAAGTEEEGLKEFLDEKIDSAKELMRNIERRKNTLLNITAIIADRQKDFFEQGVGAMKALTMREVADELDIHESTVSRAVNEKYLQFGNNVYELRFFFSNKLQGPEDEETSAAAVKSRIKEIIENEDKTKPISDQKIADILSSEGIKISRRTVAKYREGMDIPATSRRKQY